MLARCARIGLIICFSSLLVAGCGRESPTGPAAPTADLAPAGFDAELVAGEIMAVSGWQYAAEVAVPARIAGRDAKSFTWLLDWSREHLMDDIYHYSFLVQVGPGQYDRIMVHRVVREQLPYRPIDTPHALFLQHGDAVGFVKFLFGPAAPSVPDDHAAAIRLAQMGIDVWGIDQNWVLVPEDVTDFAFMAKWGLDDQIANLNAGLGVARHLRHFTANTYRKFHLLGYSSGCATGYAYLNAETAVAPQRRHVQGYICADMIYKYAPEDEVFRQLICDDAAYLLSRLEAGEYVEPIPFVPIGELAADDPDGDSPIVPGMTNREVALLFGVATFQVWPFNEWWHYFGGTFDEDGAPVAPQFTSWEGMTDFMRTGTPWETLRFLYEYEAVLCDELDLPWDDHLAEVDVPLLYLEPAGGVGSTGRHSLSLFGSTDVEILTVSLLPPDQLTGDFGHIDLWTADQAPSLVWEPLGQWVIDHAGRGASGDGTIAVSR